MCGCGGSEAVNRPESNDLIAVVHPLRLALQKAQTQSEPSLSRRDSTSSQSSTSSTVSASSSEASSNFHGGRIRFSNNATTGITTSEFSLHDTDSYGLLPAISDWRIQIHRFGFPSDIESMPNPVMHSFPIVTVHETDSDINRVIGSRVARLDLGLGGAGVLGRTVTLSDRHGNIMGEGVLGRI